MKISQQHWMIKLTPVSIGVRGLLRPSRYVELTDVRPVRLFCNSPPGRQVSNLRCAAGRGTPDIPVGRGVDTVDTEKLPDSILLRLEEEG